MKSHIPEPQKPNMVITESSKTITQANKYNNTCSHSYPKRNSKNISNFSNGDNEKIT